jgi:homoserine kinase type II
MSFDPFFEIKSILGYYDLGELVEYTPYRRGYVNTSYAIVTRQRKQTLTYFLRRYRKTILAEELEFEHAVINRLVERHFDLVARLIRTQAGQTYLHWPPEVPQGEGAYYAIFDFLPGEDKYTWIAPACTVMEYTDAAAVLARFHHTVGDFIPAGHRREPKIRPLLADLSRTIAAWLLPGKHTAFDDRLLSARDPIQSSIEHTRAALNRLDSSQLLELVIHCDYHPGNLKFQDGRVVGVFDLDWSKTDARAFDVALAVWYFFTTWAVPDDGELRIDQATAFLQAYQETLQGKPGVGPLNPFEINTFPDLLNAANLYVLNWTVQDYAHKTVDPAEYLGYLEHHLNFIAWFEGRGGRQQVEKALHAALIDGN